MFLYLSFYYLKLTPRVKEGKIFAVLNVRGFVVDKSIPDPSMPTSGLSLDKSEVLVGL
jgi:hypothetical protein